MLLQGPTSQLHQSPPRDEISQPPLHFWWSFFFHLPLKDLYHVHFWWYFSLSSTWVRICCCSCSNKQLRCTREQYRKRLKCWGVAQIHGSANATLWGTLTLAVTRQVMDRACLMHPIQTNLLVRVAVETNATLTNHTPTLFRRQKTYL